MLWEHPPEPAVMARVGRLVIAGCAALAVALLSLGKALSTITQDE